MVPDLLQSSYRYGKPTLDMKTQPEVSGVDDVHRLWTLGIILEQRGPSQHVLDYYFQLFYKKSLHPKYGKQKDFNCTLFQLFDNSISYI